jgi:outer membrane protein W
MHKTTKTLLNFALGCCFVVIGSNPVLAEDASNSAYAAPAWALEFKAGKFTPDLDEYKEFYGSDDTNYYGIASAYKFTNWLELGMELGLTRDKGTGFLPIAGIPGGDVTYTLLPLQVFLNLRYHTHHDQLFIPYAGVGAATAWYKQEIEEQSDVSGRSDIGGAARLGIELRLNGFDRRGADFVTGDRRLNTYFFVEGQYFSTKVDDIDLGGKSILVGLRFDFD